MSPVVAAIILIAVTVAVSIAVAAWMGALTFTFMGETKLQINSVTWGTGNVTLEVENIGTKAATIDDAKVNYGDISCALSSGTVTLKTGGRTNAVITFDWTNGTRYDLTVVTSNNLEFTEVAYGGHDEA